MTDQKSLPYPVLSNADLKDKTVLLRAGFDLPMNNGEVVDTSRVEALLPTIKFILDSGASLIILAHQGRPKGERNMEYSQKPIAPVLSKLIGIDVKFCDYCRGEEAKSMAAELVAGDVLLLENLRFEKAEKSKDPEQRDELAKEIAELGDVYVNDAFTNCHRDHASMTGIPKHLPSFIGLHLEQEIRHLSEATDNPSKPVTLIISGAKMETKVPVIQHFLDCGNDILLGGLIANTFIGAKGNCLGSSRYEEEWVKKSEEILSLSMKEGSALIHVPVDSIVASDPSGADVNNVPSNSIPDDMCVFDIGELTAESYAEIIAKSGTVIWNGPMGMYEQEPFSGGSKAVAAAVSKATENGVKTIIGGGDTIDLHVRYSLPIDSYTWVSTGGGAMLEFISGQKLPALEALV